MASLTACPRRVPPPELSLDPKALLFEVKASRLKVRSVKGDARLTLEGGSPSGTVHEFVAAERPDRVHIEVLDFFGNVAAVLDTGEGRFELWDAKGKIFYRGEATPENLARIVPLPLFAGELVDILCGGPPLEGAPSAVEPDEDALKLLLKGPDSQTSVRVVAGAAVERALVSPRDRPTYELFFRGLHPRVGTVFPGVVELRGKSPKVKAVLTWGNPSLNEEIDPRLFHMDPPRGARVVDLDPANGS